MYLIDIIPLARIPHTLPQILSYFHGAPLNAGALVQTPLGRRQEEGVVIAIRPLSGHKMEIKSADFELRNISKVISLEPVLTKQQIKLALFLGEYYFCSPGIFAKMMLTKTINNKQSTKNNEEKFLAKSSRLKAISPRLILAPTVARVYALAKAYPQSIIWHSELTQKQKNAARLTVKTGTAKTIIGTRSAVFLPFANLKEIIIESSDSSNHKSWDMFPHYDSRLAAQKLAEIYKAKLVLNTQRLTPSNPRLTIIDMRQELKDGNFSIFSIPLYDAVKQALTDKKQAILFINRRGAANFILCRDCGYIANCSKCDAPLAYHLINNKPSLLCHHCGLKDTPPGRCPKCHSPRIKTVGSGSQKVETETHNFFPDAKILRLDSDNAPKPKDQQKIIANFIEGKTNILIATPMVFSWLEELAAAKPAVVGILSADTLLHIPDFRSGERTWQTIASLRTLDADQLIVQTYNPENSVLKYVKNNDYAGFAKEDMETREALNYPPFSQIVKLTFRHRDAKIAGQEAKILAAKLNNVLSSCHPELVSGSQNKKSRNEFGMTKEKYTDSIEISPALPAFLPRERGKYVWNIILKFFPFSSPLFRKEGLGEIYTTSDFLQHRNSFLQYVPSNWEIDVDPEGLL